MNRTIIYISQIDNNLLNNIISNIDRQEVFNSEPYVVLKDDNTNGNLDNNNNI